MKRSSVILFVDDSIAHARIAREALADPEMRWRVVYATTGIEAADRLLNRPPFETAARPDLVLLDNVLPGLTGVDVLRTVRAEEHLRSVPIVVLMRGADLDEVQLCYELGANSVVECPVSLEEMASLYRGLVEYWTVTNVTPTA